MTADLLCLSEQKISMKTARFPVPFCIATAETGGFFHEQMEVIFPDDKTENCRRNWRKTAVPKKERGEAQ